MKILSWNSCGHFFSVGSPNLSFEIWVFFFFWFFFRFRLFRCVRCLGCLWKNIFRMLVCAQKFVRPTIFGYPRSSVSAPLLRPMSQRALAYIYLFFFLFQFSFRFFANTSGPLIRERWGDFLWIAWMCVGLDVGLAVLAVYIFSRCLIAYYVCFHIITAAIFNLDENRTSRLLELTAIQFLPISIILRERWSRSIPYVVWLIS